jgi:diguanylate cyclase
MSLQELTNRVAADVGAHSSKVAEINEELTASPAEAPKAIVNVVARLVEVNKHMQGRLDEAEDKLRQQAQLVESTAAEARTDALTLLANRRAFDDQIAVCEAELRHSGRGFSLAMFDLDHFKSFNDTYGHQAGDEVLRTAGRVLRRKTRENDTAARYGGEEFALIMFATTEEACSAVEGIRQAIEKTEVSFEGKALKITSSCGVAHSRPGETFQGLIKRADAALYGAKNGGRNCTYWHDGIEIHPVKKPAKPAPPQPAAKPEVAAKPAQPTSPSFPAESQPVPADPVAIPELLSRTALCQHVRTRVAEWKRGGPPISLVLVELDQYDAAARQYGPQAAELGVFNAVRCVAALIREMDVVAWYNPRCIAVLLPSARLTNSIRITDRVRRAIAQRRVPVGNEWLRFTASVGVVEVIDSDDSVVLLHRAEAALALAKARGGDCECYHDGHQALPSQEFEAEWTESAV